MGKYIFEKEDKRRLEMISIPYIIFRFVNDQLEILLVSDGFCSLYGCTRNEAMQIFQAGKSCKYHENESANVRSIYQKILDNGGMYDLLFHSQTFQGMNNRRVHVRVETIESQNEQPLMIAFFMLEKKQSVVNDYVAEDKFEEIYTRLLSECRLYSLDHFDSLTGIPNTNFFLNLAVWGRRNIIFRKEQPVVLSFNLNGLKMYNTKYGMKSGDRLLVDFSRILTKRFGRYHCGRFGEDHFYVFTSAYRIEAYLNEIFDELKIRNNGKTLSVRVGIYLWNKKSKKESKTLPCDRARIACESIGSIYESKYVYFDPKMEKAENDKDYILNHLSGALESGAIKVYYQPKIRTINGKLCGMEALARWMDPKMGCISPDMFIPTLERNLLTYKLDIYVIQQVAKDLCMLRDRGFSLVPVSFNLSRTDFIASDPCQILLDVVRESGLARDLFRVEITESTVMSDPERMKREIARFHQHGFQVLMDDFGSGYSSLNTLRDYDFDEIKIDMGFMKSFGDRSKKILKPIISMTKSLGIHTLTEGVETQEQLDFLKEIGCEQIQGFYYGKPDPLFQMYASLDEKDIISENREELAFFNKVGLIDVITDVPTALYYFNGSIFDVYYMNTNYRNILTGDSYPFHKPMDEIMNSEKSPSRDGFLSVARAAMHSGKEERFTSIYQGRYYLFTCQMIARNSHGVMFKSTLNDFRENESMRISDKMDQSIRTILLAYESVYLIDLDKDSREVIQSNIIGEKAGDKVYHLYEFYQNYMVREIYPDDRERFESFIDPFTWQPLLQQKGKYSDIFRYKRADGRTVYMEILLIAIPNSYNNQILICIKPAGFTNEEMNQVLRIISGKHDYHVQINEHSQNDDGILWHNLMRFSNLKMFVLDDHQKILGVSETFREYFDIKSRDSLIGKKAKDLSFLLDSAQCMEDNRIVLSQGKVISHTMIKVVVRGIIKQLLLTKFPVHHNGKISGIIGYFNETDPSMDAVDTFHNMKTIDKVTGFFNEMGMLTTSIDYHENYRMTKEIYYISMIDLPDFDTISEDYGKSIGEKLLQKIANVIRGAYPSDAVFCRVHGAHFVIYQKINSINLARKNIQNAIRNLCCISEVDEYPCTLYPRFCLSECTEEESAIELYQLCLTRLK